MKKFREIMIEKYLSHMKYPQRAKDRILQLSDLIFKRVQREKNGKGKSRGKITLAHARLYPVKKI